MTKKREHLYNSLFDGLPNLDQLTPEQAGPIWKDLHIVQQRFNQDAPQQSLERLVQGFNKTHHPEDAHQ